MNPHFVRILRTPHSERFAVQLSADVDSGALDLHYLPDGTVAGTLILLENVAPVREEDLPELLRIIDDQLLPDVSIEEGKLSFTVVVGRAVGNFVPQGHPVA